MKTLSIVKPGGQRIASGQKTLEVRRWQPNLRSDEDLLIVENSRFLHEEGEMDHDGQAVAIVRVKNIRPFRQEDMKAACATGFEPGWLAWELEQVRPVMALHGMPAARGIYDLDFQPLKIREEIPEDAKTISEVIEKAFEHALHSNGDESGIVTRLRENNALSLSLVAEENGVLLGHIAFSSVQISDGSEGWFGLGPVSVLPEVQKKGIGRMLIQEGLKRLEQTKARGCVLLGDPAYYSRLGFRSNGKLWYQNLNPAYMQFICFSDDEPEGEVHYSKAFDST